MPFAYRRPKRHAPAFRFIGANPFYLPLIGRANCAVHCGAFGGFNWRHFLLDATLGGNDSLLGHNTGNNRLIRVFLKSAATHAMSPFHVHGRCGCLSWSQLLLLALIAHSIR
jgi:hypothetical protein